MRATRWLGHGIALIGLTFFAILILGKDAGLRSYFVPFVAFAIPLALIALFLRIGFLWVQDGRQPLADSGIDWTQGLIRLWVVVTLIGAGLLLYIQRPEHSLATLAWLPPLGVWMAGLMVRGILEGFRNES